MLFNKSACSWEKGIAWLARWANWPSRSSIWASSWPRATISAFPKASILKLKFRSSILAFEESCAVDSMGNGRHREDRPEWAEASRFEWASKDAKRVLYTYIKQLEAIGLSKLEILQNMSHLMWLIFRRKSILSKFYYNYDRIIYSIINTS